MVSFFCLVLLGGRKYMRILLIDAPYINLYGVHRIAVGRYFPLSLGYLAAVLEKGGHTVKIATLNGVKDYESIIENLVKEYLPQLIGFTAMTPSFPMAVKLAEKIRIWTSCPLVIGGSHVSAFGEHLWNQTAVFDGVIMGEGEYTLLELANYLAEGGDQPTHIPGLIWKLPGSQPINNVPRSFLVDLDKLPFPARHLVELDKFSTSSHIKGKESLTMITSRGCPFNCRFCSSHMVHGRQYRVHSPGYVVEEIIFLKNTYNLKYIFFQDDTFTLNRERLEKILDLILSKELKIKWGCFSRVDILDKQMASLFKRSGCESLVFGIESGSQMALEKMNKKISLEQVRKAITVCEEIGIRSLASFVVGFPFETRKDIQQTIKFAKTLPATKVVFNPLVPFPGSSFFNKSRHFPGKLEGWSRFLTTKEPPFQMVQDCTPSEIYRLVKRGHISFYLRPKQLMRMGRSIHSWNDFLSYCQGAISLSRQLLKG